MGTRSSIHLLASLLSPPPSDMQTWSNEFDVIAPIALAAGHELNLDTLVDAVIGAHAGRTRDGSPAPYVIHPMRVALALLTLFPDGLAGAPAADMFAAGLAHDVIEEAPEFTNSLRMTTNSQVFDAVVQLSKPPA